MGHVVIAPAISIHALREEGDPASCLTLSCSVISIHALREEGDGSRRARGTSGSGISIHALREEGDPYFIRSVAFL